MTAKSPGANGFTRHLRRVMPLHLISLRFLSESSHNQHRTPRENDAQWKQVRQTGRCGRSKQLGHSN